MFLNDFLSIFNKLESKFLIVIMSLKKKDVRFLMFTCLILPIYMFNGIAFSSKLFER